MELGEPDASGRRRPVEVPGVGVHLDVDCVIMAIGTSPNPLDQVHHPGPGDPEVGRHHRQGGDGPHQPGRACTPAATRSQAQPRSFLAMGAGKTAATAIDGHSGKSKAFKR